MGKKIIKSCDVCGKDITDKDYLVCMISIISKGKTYRHPSIWVCPECWKKSSFPLVPIKDK